MKQIGKIGKRNLEANRRLKEQYEELGILACELRFEGCYIDNFLTFAHKHKRVWYLSKPELLYSLDETLLACVKCHDKIEVSRVLTEKMFTVLRPT